MTVRSNIPRRYTSDNELAALRRGYIFQNFALYIVFEDGFKTLLPLAVDIIGCRAMPFMWDYYSKENRSFASWTDDDIGAALQEHFSGLPLLRVTDSTMLHNVPGAWVGKTYEMKIRAAYLKDIDNGIVAPRVYADTWFLTLTLQPYMLYHAPPFAPVARSDREKRWAPGRIHRVFEVEGTYRFTQPRLVLEEFRKYGHQVSIEKATLTPFAVLRIDEVTVHLATPSTPSEDAHERVDGQLTCRLAYEYTQAQTDGSALCERHKQRIEELSEAGQLEVHSLVGIAPSDISFNLPHGINTADYVKRMLKLLNTIR